MAAGNDQEVDAPSPEGVVTDVTGTTVWRLLLRGLGVFLPGWRMTPESVRVPRGPGSVGLPAFLTPESGFGLHLSDRGPVPAPDREIYVRGREVQSIGVVLMGSASAIGSRVVDAVELLRYARRITFETLYDGADAASATPAAQAARAVENVVLLDPAAELGICAQFDARTGAAGCPLLVSFDDRATRTVRAYAAS
ncbi:hypothetical protein DPM19_25550 [Actinomadura craniellae]|uniref:Uncharacterized protein n=1 Tax=Actinomadura craniellae TaxID=2231787 RepID=A0A365H0A0_9ACTN|nr:hypothetical protein [Actinomadura craniellae]RAY12500.1 hypothetical protein DPM19_25550 [Actinomadura craniellae]